MEEKKTCCNCKYFSTSYSEETWTFWSGSHGTTFKEAVYDTDDEKTIIWG